MYCGSLYLFILLYILKFAATAHAYRVPHHHPPLVPPVHITRTTLSPNPSLSCPIMDNSAHAVVPPRSSPLTLRHSPRHHPHSSPHAYNARTAWESALLACKRECECTAHLRSCLHTSQIPRLKGVPRVNCAQRWGEVMGERGDHWDNHSRTKTSMNALFAFTLVFVSEQEGWLKKKREKVTNKCERERTRVPSSLSYVEI